MPELPEVEVVKKSLESQINNLIIKKVVINDGKLRYKINKNHIKKVQGLKILSIKRRSKYLLIYLKKRFVLVVHLGMTGKFFIIKKNKEKQKTSFYYDIENYSKKHDRVIFIFNDKSKLIYNDVRKFGFIKFLSIKELSDNLHFKNLGPEPLSNLYNIGYFKKYLIKKNRKIKDLLMDQKFVSGLGNIYVNEILFFSKISPIKNISKLSDKEIKKIINHTKKVLKKAIILGGSSIKNFTNSSGKKGNFQQHFRVYGRKSLLCSNADCKYRIKKIVISNRASFFCPKCQK